MANVQQYFEQFNERIRLGRFEENQTLREKRDIIRDKLDARLPGIFEKYGELCPTYSFRDQGSYEMGTGVQPLNGDFDIDQGLYFAVRTDEYPDPVVLKQRVHEALVDHTERVEIRRPCVTVFYQRTGESIYHVDIAVYSDGSNNLDRKSRLAKGKEFSAPEHRVWEVSDPQGLASTILNRFDGNDRTQFRRVVRYLKRWKDENFSPTGHAAPLGIALTVAAYDDLQPAYTDRFAGKPDDQEALRQLVPAMLSRFQSVWDHDQQEWVQRLAVPLPVEPRNDLCARMSNKQMAEFKAKLEALCDALDAAAQEVDPVEACKTLRGVFGRDFPVPEKEATAKHHRPAFASSSSSA